MLDSFCAKGTCYLRLRPKIIPAQLRLALQYGFRHYCGSDGVCRSTPGKIIDLNHKHMRNAVL